MKKAGKKSKYLLDIFVKIRTVKALDRAVSRNSAYQDTLKRQDKAFDKLDKAGLSNEQSAIVDRAISAANDCGAAYGAAAYRLGLQDGIRLVYEMKEFE
ncbi:MAG: hypothetical protein NC347_15370 [Clostridium sp.]|nr:hypothetical protein [Clostridium sp.]